MNEKTVDYDLEIKVRKKPLSGNLFGWEKTNNVVEINFDEIAQIAIIFATRDDAIGTNENGVIIKCDFKDNQMYVPNSTKLINSNYPKGTLLFDDWFVNGQSIGYYSTGANAAIIFEIKAPKKRLFSKKETLINAESFIFENVNKNAKAIIRFI